MVCLERIEVFFVCVMCSSGEGEFFSEWLISQDWDFGFDEEFFCRCVIEGICFVMIRIGIG